MVPLCSESLWASRAGAAAHKPHEAKPGPLARLAAPLLPCPLTPPQPRGPPSGLHSGTALGLESAPFLSQTKGRFSNTPCLPPVYLSSLLLSLEPFLFIIINLLCVICYNVCPLYKPHEDRDHAPPLFLACSRNSIKNICLINVQTTQNQLFEVQNIHIICIL